MFLIYVSVCLPGVLVPLDTADGSMAHAISPAKAEAQPIILITDGSHAPAGIDG
jgi:hypothetical protein